MGGEPVRCELISTQRDAGLRAWLRTPEMGAVAAPCASPLRAKPTSPVKQQEGRVRARPTSPCVCAATSCDSIAASQRSP
eukprot:scaffold180_cov134-Isochrysis_galbana.AAC.5